MKFRRTIHFILIALIGAIIIALGVLFTGCDVNDPEAIPLPATGLYEAEFSSYEAVLFLIESGNPAHGDYQVKTADLQLRRRLSPNSVQKWHFALKGSVTSHRDPFVHKVFTLANEGDSQYDSLIVTLNFDGEKLYGLMVQKQQFISGWADVMRANVVFRTTTEERLAKKGYALTLIQRN